MRKKDFKILNDCVDYLEQNCPMVNEPYYVIATLKKSSEALQEIYNYLMENRPTTSTEVLKKIIEIHDSLPKEKQTMTCVPNIKLYLNTKVAGV